MLQRWRSLPCLLLSLVLPSLAHASPSFENTGIVRTVELGGSLVHSTTTFNVKALESGADIYNVALSQDEKSKTSWMEVTMKGKKEPLKVEDLGFDSETYVYSFRTHTQHLIY
jgi:oligosaccharyltransferase complex subunit alpha (ribophorin I)